MDTTVTGIAAVVVAELRTVGYMMMSRLMTNKNLKSLGCVVRRVTDAVAPKRIEMRRRKSR